MGCEWQLTSLGSVLNLKRGYDLAAREREPGNIPIISSSGMSGLHSRPMVQAPGVVTGRYGTIGRVHFVEEAFWPLNTTLYVQDFKGNDPRFIYNLLKTISYQDYLDKAAVPGINRNDVHKAQVFLPPLAEQRKISATLTALDDRISSLQAHGATLEKVAQTIFKSWFVDFDPVRAKAEGREPEGMDAATAALFPAVMDATGRELTPECWSKENLGALSDVGIGKTPPRGQSQWFSESKVDTTWVSIRDMGKSGIYISSSAEFLTREAIRRFNVRIVPNNTVIISFKLTVGRLAITDGELATNEAIAHCVLAENARVTPEYLYCALSAFDFTSLASTSSIAEAVNSKTIRDLAIVVPSKPLVDAFSGLVSPLFRAIKNNQRCAATLAELRDTLLPRLISGKLRIPEAEELVEGLL